MKIFFSNLFLYLSDFKAAAFPFACELGFKYCIELSKNMFQKAVRDSLFYKSVYFIFSIY